MTPQMRQLIDDRDVIEAALGFLASRGIACDGALRDYEHQLERAMRQPTEADQRWPRTQPIPIEEHLRQLNGTLNNRPTLSTSLEAGRMYSLTPAQRDIVRDWFSITPAALIEILDVDMFDGTPYIRCITFVSAEHQPSTRKHLLKRFTLDKWGEFCEAVKAREAARAEERFDADAKPKKERTTKVDKTAATLKELMEEYD